MSFRHPFVIDFIGNYTLCYTSSMEGDERYVRQGDVLYKADLEGDPDKQGLEFHIVDELDNGFTVYIKPQDPSQPNPNYFIHKKYLLK